MSIKKVVAFGEILGRVSPRGFAAFGDEGHVLLFAGGSEANVLAKVGGLAPGIQTQFVTKMKRDLLGQLIRMDLQKHRIGMDYVIWTDTDRNGLCFAEQGIGPLTAEVSYDRAGSALAMAEPGEFDFSVLHEADAFFVSGITAALSERSLKNVNLALETAKRHRVPAFIDVNYRNKLWTTMAARAALEEMIRRELFTGLIITETDARVVFGIDCGFNDDAPMDDLIACSEKILRGLSCLFGGRVPILITTVRKRISNERGEWTSVALIEGRTPITSDVLPYVIIDRLGAGDSCSAGIIGGFIGVRMDGDISEALPLEERIRIGMNLGNRMSVVAQKTACDLGPQWPAAMYFKRVGKTREIVR